MYRQFIYIGHFFNLSLEYSYKGKIGPNYFEAELISFGKSF
jgi:hypothetical protein